VGQKLVALLSAKKKPETVGGRTFIWELITEKVGD
jgi:hypothetical protein